MKTSWGGVSGWYDELLEKREGTYQKEVILPNLLRLVGPISGANILDLACGQGFFARELAKGGSAGVGVGASAPAKVFGADIAKELIEIAKKNPDPFTRKIEYHVATSNSLVFCADHTIDIVTIVLALQNIEDLAGTLRECARVLKPAGRLFIVLNHPAFRIPKNSSWQWDHGRDMTKPGVGAPGAGQQFRRIDAYMSESRQRIDMNPGVVGGSTSTNANGGDGELATSKKFTVSFHRPLQVYFKALAKAGFNIARLEEWVSHKNSIAGPRAEEENRIRKEIPMFLTLEARLK